MANGLVIGPAVLMGIIIGYYEAHLVHADEGNVKGAMGHALHTIPVTMILVAIAMNVSFALHLFKLEGIPVIGNVHVVRAVIGIFAAGKLHAVSALAKGVSGMSERWMHCFLVAGMIVATPYLYDMFVYPVADKVLPKSLRWLIEIGGETATK